MAQAHQLDQEKPTTPCFSEQQLLQLLADNYQLAGALKPLDGYCDQNLLLTTVTGSHYIVKVANSAEKSLALAMQNAAMTHLTNKALAVPHALVNKQQQQLTLITDACGVKFYLRVLSYLAGGFYADNINEKHQIELWQSLGKFIAEINNGLSDFSHPGAYRFFEWDLAHGFAICQTKKHLLNAAEQELVAYFLGIYQTQTMALLAQCRQGVIHNDANNYNLLVNSTDCASSVIGLIDFGDMVFSHVINELAITCAYALMKQEEPINALVTIVASYHQHHKLTATELEVLLSLIALRLCVSVCHSAQAIKAQPENTYLLVSAKPAWQLLTQLQKCNAYAVLCQLRLACGFDVDGGKSKTQISAFRKKHLGKTLSLSYQQPLKIVRGQGAYLFDEQGQRYLDMVNNVCHVGHCHPKVVAAGQAQLAKLNTNTRYLHDNIVNYAEKLLATMPEQLSVCMFVNSGSEANELAFRLAKNYSKGTELLVVDGAYHGNTNACIEASPYKFSGPGGAGAAEYVHIVDLPDPYRGKYIGDSPEVAAAYANSVSKVLNDIAKQGKQPSAFICESLQGVAGQIIMPAGYLSAVYQQVRSAGGVCIADEVQVGFGRVGTHMWAFETQGVIPDIVTLGKPIGNGHPMAAVITTQAIADAFVNGMEYFNTFGGNPVSCAIGSAVLDVIYDEKLPQHALEAGAYFMAQLKQVQQAFALIGDVRGLGLFIGVELVENSTTKEPATHKTEQLVEFFKQHNILLSTEGRYYNILKIKPPLAISITDINEFISVLRLGLARFS